VNKQVDYRPSRKTSFFEKKFKFWGLHLAEKMRCGYSTWLGSGGRGILEEQ
jgi:hypothetical protein